MKIKLTLFYLEITISDNNNIVINYKLFIMKILSIDGGGVRGIILARILQELEIRTGKNISELFNIISGTSTVELLALAIAKPGTENKPTFSAKDILDFYLNRSKEIFPKPSLFRKVKTGFGL